MSEPSYSAPTFIDNGLYVIRSDIKELLRHIGMLADDLTFSTGQNAVKAIKKFEEEAIKIFGKANRAGRDQIATARQQMGFHPGVTILGVLGAGAIVGALMLGLSHADRHKH